MRPFKKYKFKNFSLKKRKGGCNCVKITQYMKGGDDYFLPGYTEPPSFDKVPIHSFYGQNMYTVDPQGSQVSSRLIPNMSGGKKTLRKRKKIILKKKIKSYKKNNRKVKITKKKRMKGGVSTILMRTTTDPLLNSTNNTTLSHGNISGSLLGYNILGGLQPTLSPSLVNIQEAPLA